MTSHAAINRDYILLLSWRGRDQLHSTLNMCRFDHVFHERDYGLGMVVKGY